MGGEGIVMSTRLASVLVRHDVEQLHAHSLDLLERVGIDYKTPKALEILEKLGCPVDYDRTWAALPREVVEWALRQAPRVVRLCARDPAHDVILDGRFTHFTPDSQGTKAIDFETGEVRPATAEDLSRGLLFADALSNIDIVNVMVAANDVPAHVRTIRHFALAFTQTSKPIRTGVLHAGQVPFLIEMVKTVTGSDTFRPIFSVVDCTISPLMHDGPMTEACIELAKLNVPIMVYPMPLAGGTSPVTLSGTALVHNIEFLSGLVLFQAVNPGAPVIYGSGASQLDMKTGQYGNSADGHLLRLALLDMARFYNLPVNLWGCTTSSASFDPICGHEATAHALLACLSGADEAYGAGLFSGAQILSLTKMVLDNHLVDQIRTIAGTLLADEAHIQADLIARVGIGGNYLTHRETREFTRKEYVHVWPPAGKTAEEVARAEAFDILHNHKPLPLPDGASNRLEAIVGEADRAFAGKV
jgi:trimethylamine--corrinoid protein Co-methyltransferase